MCPLLLKERSASRKDTVPSHTICSQEGGAVLVLVLLLTGFLLLLGSALLTIASSERQIGSNDRSGAQALYLAEAAIERTRRLLPGFSVNDVLVNNLLLGEWVNGTSTASGTYRATVTNNVASIGGLHKMAGQRSVEAPRAIPMGSWSSPGPAHSRITAGGQGSGGGSADPESAGSTDACELHR
jgi:hypothetical protein